MDAAWKAMEKKEKIPWIKKAAEDQKRYEVQYRTVVSDQTFWPLSSHLCWRNVKCWSPLTFLLPIVEAEGSAMDALVSQCVQ